MIKIKTGKLFGLIALSSLLFTVMNCSNSPTETKPDTTPPQITLSKTAISVEMCDTITYPQSTAVDETDGNLTDKITRSGVVNLAKLGKYSIQYSVTDKSGNSSTAACTVEVKIPSSTILYLPLDGDIKDESKNNLTGTSKGAVPGLDRFGNGQSAYYFNGNSYLEFDNYNIFNIPDSFAVSLWAKSEIMPSAYSDEGFIIDMGYVADSGYGLRLHAANDKVIPYYNNMPNDISTIPAFDTLWHHYVFQFDGTDFVYFVDGNKLLDQKGSVGHIKQYPLRIGTESKKIERFWKGSVDDVLIMSSTLNGNQVKNLAAQKSDKIIIDTTKKDTTTIDTTSGNSSISGLKAEITGTSGNLQLKLSWNAVAGASVYGVYYDEGATITDNYLYRIAMNNYKVFTTDLTENQQYTFAVSYTKDDKESPLSKTITVTYKP